MGTFLSQNLRMVPVPERASGNFLEEHCYIVFHLSMQGVCLRGGLAQLGSVMMQTKPHSGRGRLAAQESTPGEGYHL